MDGRVSKRHRISRRAALRGSALGATGLLGAALIGCGDDDEVAITPAATTPAANGAAAPAPSPDDVRRGGVLRIAFPDDIATYDQHQTTVFYDVQAMSLVYDQLLQYDPFENGRIISNLAHSWEAPDETTIVFHLNEAQFHNGAQFTSEDVAASMERQKDPPAGVRALRQPSFEILDRVETPDDRTAVLHMTRPSASFVNLSAVSYMAIYSAADVHNDGFDHHDNTNGTGPFQLDRHDRGSRLVFSRNPNYYEEGDLPYLDGVELFVVPEEVTRLASFRSGDLDKFRPGVAQVADIEAMDAQLLVAPAFSFYTYSMATWKEPWNDERTWTAISLATDRDSSNRAMLDGRGFKGGPMPPGSQFGLPESEMEGFAGYTGDIDARRTEARQLLDAVGVAEGTEVAVLSWDTATLESHALVFTDGLHQIGLNTQLTLVERATYDERLNTLDYGDMAAHTRNAALDDPTPVFADNYIEGAGRNYSGLALPEVEDLYRQQESTLDPEERIEVARDLQRAFLGTFPLDIAIFAETRVALQSDVQGHGVLYGNWRVSRKMQWVWLDR